MVDWERVSRLRSKGRDWDVIAADKKVHFTPPEGVDDAGKALKTLYYSKRSHGSEEKGKEATGGVPKGDARKVLFPLGMIIAIGGGIWFAFASLVSVIGFVLPAIPVVLLVAVAGVVLLVIGLFLDKPRISEVWKKPVAIGVVLGLVLSGSLALYATELGVPNLNSPYQEATGHNWEGAHNEMWKSNGLPVLFYYGSLACPYCSASSWAVYKALSDFGTFTGVTFTSSNPADIYPNTPEVDLTSISYSSNAISWDGKEGNNNQALSEPGLDVYEQAFVNYYMQTDTSCHGIPLYVVGGIFIEPDSIVDPAVLHNGENSQPLYTAQQIASIISGSTSNPQIYSDIVTSGAYYLEAYLYEADVKAGVTPPSSVASNPSVMSIAASIS
jgi:hypothetical protein